MESDEKDSRTPEQEIARMFRVYRTVHEMVIDRVKSLIYIIYNSLFVASLINHRST